MEQFSRQDPNLMTVKGVASLVKEIEELYAGHCPGSADVLDTYEPEAIESAIKALTNISSAATDSPGSLAVLSEISSRLTFLKRFIDLDVERLLAAVRDHQDEWSEDRETEVASIRRAAGEILGLCKEFESAWTAGGAR